MNISIDSPIAVLFYVLGIVCAIFSLWRSRTQQGATAWVVGLIAFPFVAVPLFLIFGHNKFYGYVNRRKSLEKEAQKEAAEAEKIFSHQTQAPMEMEALAALALRARQPAFTTGNLVELLIDASSIYDSLIKDLERAENYILFQFYIFREDEVGLRFADALIKQARAGKRIYFMYDGIGTSLSRKFIRRLQDVGIETGRFQSTKTIASRFQINFRNHRKIVIIDGKIAYVGGANIGKEYLGQSSLGLWHDVQLRLEGPSVLAAQLSFIKDWYWIHSKMPDLDWKVSPQANGERAMILHTGPADEEEACLLGHLALFSAAKRRIWIANPYIVPPESLINALALASLRGVEVKLIVPSRNDNAWISFASELFIEKLMRAGVKVYKFKAGFNHHKVILIDGEAASIGSANLDSRSLFINFEITAISLDNKLASKVEEMFERDFLKCREFKLSEITNRPLWRQLFNRAISLLSPML